MCPAVFPCLSTTQLTDATSTISLFYAEKSILKKV